MASDPQIPAELLVYRSLFNTAMLGEVHLSPEGRLLLANNAFAAMLGFSPDEIIGINVAELTHPDDLEVSRKRISDLFLGVTSEIQVGGRCRHKDGRFVRANISASLMRDAQGKPTRLIALIQWNITENKNAKKAVRESEARLRLVMRSGKIGIWELNPTTGETVWSKIFRELIGVPENISASSDAFNQTIHPADREQMEKDSVDLREKGRGGFQPFRILRPDGSVRWLQNVGNVVRAGDKLIGAVVDVTAARESEEIIQAQKAKMITAAKMSALGEMAGGLAHEINNPVAIIHGNATMLGHLAAKGNVPPEEMKRAVEIIVQTAERISKITRSLRAFARDAEQDPFEWVSLKSVLDDTAEFCRERFRDHGIEFTCEPVDPNLKMECRPVQISQVLLNLLNNAHDAVEHLPKRLIHISVVDSEKRVRIYVADSGPGIPEKLRDRIFQPFFTTKEVGKGTGLGLSVASGLVESHGGRLSLDSTYDATRFVVDLPKRQ